MNKVDDLTILLRARDETRKAFQSVSGRVKSLSKQVATVAKVGFAALGAAITTALTKAFNTGREVVGQLQTMGSVLGVTTREADALVMSIREFVPSAQIDRVQESVLTLQEAFFDARAESGPLFALLKDFGTDIDFSVEGPREQLVELLKVLRQMPSESDRVGAAISTLGGDDAKALVPLVRNLDQIDQLIVQLSTDIDAMPAVISEADQAGVDAYRMSTFNLSTAWEQFSKSIFVLLAPAIARANELMTVFLDRFTAGVQKLSDFFQLVRNERGVEAAASVALIDEQIKSMTASVDMATAAYEKLQAQADSVNPNSRVGETFTNQAAAQQRQLTALTDNLKELRSARAEAQKVADSVAAAAPSNLSSNVDARGGVVAIPTVKEGRPERIPVVNEYGKFSDIDAFEAFYAQHLIDQELLKADVLARRADIGAEELSFLQQLDNDAAGRAPLGVPQVGEGAVGRSRFNTQELSDGASEAGLGGMEELGEGADASAEKVNSLSNSFGSLSKVVGQFSTFAGRENQKTFKSFQTLQIGLSTVAALSAAIQAANDPKLQGFAKVAAYGAVLGTLLAGVAQLRSIKLGSGSAGSSGGGSSGGAAVPTSGATAVSSRDLEPQRRERNISINVPNGLFSGSQVGDVVEEIVRELNDNDGGQRIRLDRVETA